MTLAFLCVLLKFLAEKYSNPKFKTILTATAASTIQKDGLCSEHFANSLFFKDLAVICWGSWLEQHVALTHIIKTEGHFLTALTLARSPGTVLDMLKFSVAADPVNPRHL